MNDNIPADATIVEAMIIPSNPSQGRYQATLIASFSDLPGVLRPDVLTWFDDELHFSLDEFIGLTKKQVNDLFFRKDQQYLSTP